MELIKISILKISDGGLNIYSNLAKKLLKAFAMSRGLMIFSVLSTIALGIVRLQLFEEISLFLPFHLFLGMILSWKNLVKLNCLLFFKAWINIYALLVSYMGSTFLQGSSNSITFGKEQFLIDMDVLKPELSKGYL